MNTANLDKFLLEISWWLLNMLHNVIIIKEEVTVYVNYHKRYKYQPHLARQAYY